MGKIFAKVIASIGRYFITFYYILSYKEDKLPFISDKGDDKDDNEDDFVYTYFFYMVLAIYLVYLVIEKFIFQNSSESKMSAFLAGVSDIESEKNLIISCIVLLLGINLLAFVFTESPLEKKIVTKFCIYTFSTQLSAWIFLGILAIPINLLGLLEEDANVLATLITIVIFLFIACYFLFCVFFLPFHLIEATTKANLIGQKTASLLRWFAFTPLVIALLIRLLIPFKETREEYVIKFINHKGSDKPLIEIHSDSTKYYRLTMIFTLSKKVDEAVYIDPTDAFFIRYLMYDDKNNNKRIDSWEKKHDDTISLSSKTYSGIVALKDEPSVFEMTGVFDRQKYDTFIYVLENTEGHAIQLNMRTATDSIVNIIYSQPVLSINNKIVNLNTKE